MIADRSTDADDAWHKLLAIDGVFHRQAQIGILERCDVAAHREGLEPAAGDAVEIHFRILGQHGGDARLDPDASR